MLDQTAAGGQHILLYLYFSTFIIQTWSIELLHMGHLLPYLILGRDVEQLNSTTWLDFDSTLTQINYHIIHGRASYMPIEKSMKLLVSLDWPTCQILSYLRLSSRCIAIAGSFLYLHHSQGGKTLLNFFMIGILVHYLHCYCIYYFFLHSMGYDDVGQFQPQNAI